MEGGADVSSSGISAWLQRVADRRDLTLPPPIPGGRCAAILGLFSRLATEFADYRSVVDGAMDAARRNGVQLAEAVAAGAKQSGQVSDAAAAIAQARDRAGAMTGAAEDLPTLAGAASAAARGAS